MTVYYRIFPFDNSGSYESLLKDISSITQAHMTVYKGYFFDNSGSYDSLLQDISSIHSITQAHMTVSFDSLYFFAITQAHMTVYCRIFLR